MKEVRSESQVPRFLLQTALYLRSKNGTKAFTDLCKAALLIYAKQNFLFKFKDIVYPDVTEQDWKAIWKVIEDKIVKKKYVRLAEFNKKKMLYTITDEGRAEANRIMTELGYKFTINRKMIS